MRLCAMFLLIQTLASSGWALFQPAMVGKRNLSVSIDCPSRNTVEALYLQPTRSIYRFNFPDHRRFMETQLNPNEILRVYMDGRLAVVAVRGGKEAVRDWTDVELDLALAIKRRPKRLGRFIKGCNRLNKSVADVLAEPLREAEINACEQLVAKSAAYERCLNRGDCLEIFKIRTAKSMVPYEDFSFVQLLEKGKGAVTPMELMAASSASYKAGVTLFGLKALIKENAGKLLTGAKTAVGLSARVAMGFSWASLAVGGFMLVANENHCRQMALGQRHGTDQTSMQDCIEQAGESLAQSFVNRVEDAFQRPKQFLATIKKAKQQVVGRLTCAALESRVRNLDTSFTELENLTCDEDGNTKVQSLGLTISFTESGMPYIQMPSSQRLFFDLKGDKIYYVNRFGGVDNAIKLTSKQQWRGVYGLREQVRADYETGRIMAGSVTSKLVTNLPLPFAQRYKKLFELMRVQPEHFQNLALRCQGRSPSKHFTGRKQIEL